MHYLYTDGGSRGNPGKSAVGYFIFDEDKKLLDYGGKYIGIGTNNKAEYLALKSGLQLCKKHDIKEVTCCLDSELVVNQLNKVYKVSNPEIKKFFEAVILEKKFFDSIEFTHIPRSSNKFADKMVNLILDNLDEAA
jgi:ribonuclease HI